MPTLDKFSNPTDNKMCVICDKPFKRVEGVNLFDPDVCKGESQYTYDFTEEDIIFVCKDCFNSLKEKKKN